MPSGTVVRRVRSWASALRRLLDRRAVILSYHRIAEVDCDPWDLAVSPAHFAEHLEVIRRLGRPISLEGLERGLRAGEIPRGAVAVTFDDGYADNLLEARPRLEERGVPATIFLAAGLLDAAVDFWWERLAALLLRPGRLPAVLELEIRGRTHRWSVEPEYGTEQARAHRSWRAWQDLAPTDRHRAYRELFGLLRPLGEGRDAVLAEMSSWAGGARPSGARPLSRPEAARLGSELIEIGAHTVTHPRLSTLPTAEKIREVHESRRALEEIAGRGVTRFAYPYGQPGDYDAESVAIVREAGFTLACANVPGAASRRSDVFGLPRFHVSDWDGDVFEENLGVWLRAA